jgi:hypothetical protein
MLLKKSAKHMTIIVFSKNSAALLNSQKTVLPALAITNLTIMEKARKTRFVHFVVIR